MQWYRYLRIPIRMLLDGKSVVGRTIGGSTWDRGQLPYRARRDPLSDNRPLTRSHDVWQTRLPNQSRTAFRVPARCRITISYRRRKAQSHRTPCRVHLPISSDSKILKPSSLRKKLPACVASTTNGLNHGVSTHDWVCQPLHASSSPLQHHLFLDWD